MPVLHSVNKLAGTQALKVVDNLKLYVQYLGIYTCAVLLQVGWLLQE